VQISYQVKGLTGVMNRLNGMSSGTKTALKGASADTARYLKSQVPPPPPPTENYVRTQKLEKNFKGSVTPVSNGYAVSLSNPTSYAPWVISDSRVGGLGPQTWIHRGRWYTIQQVLRKSTSGVLDIYQNALRRLMR